MRPGCHLNKRGEESMSHRGWAKDPKTGLALDTFDPASLKDAGSGVGFLGVPQALSGRVVATVVIVAVALVVAMFLAHGNGHQLFSGG